MMTTQALKATATVLITRPDGVLVYWKWFCPAHDWSGTWELFRDTAREGAFDHDVAHHGAIDEDYDD